MSEPKRRRRQVIEPLPKESFEEQFSQENQNESQDEPFRPEFHKAERASSNQDSQPKKEYAGKEAEARIHRHDNCCRAADDCLHWRRSAVQQCILYLSAGAKCSFKGKIYGSYQIVGGIGRI